MKKEITFLDECFKALKKDKRFINDSAKILHNTNLPGKRLMLLGLANNIENKNLGDLLLKINEKKLILTVKKAIQELR